MLRMVDWIVHMSAGGSLQWYAPPVDVHSADAFDFNSRSLRKAIEHCIGNELLAIQNVHPKKGRIVRLDTVEIHQNLLDSFGRGKWK